MVDPNDAWPDLPCYLLLDTVREPGIKRWLYETEANPKHFSLYLMTKYKSMIDQSPELIQTELYSDLWYSFMERGVRQHWGLVLFSEAPFEAVKQHCQWWLNVITPSGSKGLFRLYDPTLSWRLFATSTPEQLAYLFGPINQVHCYANQWHAFHNPAPIVGDYSSSLRLAANQWQAISDSKYQGFLNRLQKHISHYFPHLLAGKDQQQQQTWLEKLVNTANTRQFTTAQDIFFFTNVVGYLGADAMNPALHPEIHQLITHSSQLTPSQRIRKAAIKAQQVAGRS
ncbi:DUF4123 domain-containing protein [Spartinivicinus poritis]|uniref:DUF4123 domain-containing protein n=1 Tax=Spartinivicinus poritis TaxID=2994640 RepID=A0ABT5UBX8_9GAMM|nr:DUF4123 domain-containing protein [Spartinivicinus sp. A2-2]MDE1463832.1 DUF4123 domain-containing protein [Spartinivicinus sp. A2-2]